MQRLPLLLVPAIALCVAAVQDQPPSGPDALLPDTDPSDFSNLTIPGCNDDIIAMIRKNPQRAYTKMKQLDNTNISNLYDLVLNHSQLSFEDKAAFVCLLRLAHAELPVISEYHKMLSEIPNHLQRAIVDAARQQVGLTELSPDVLVNVLFEPLLSRYPEYYQRSQSIIVRGLLLFANLQDSAVLPALQALQDYEIGAPLLLVALILSTAELQDAYSSLDRAPFWEDLQLEVADHMPNHGFMTSMATALPKLLSIGEFVNELLMTDNKENFRLFLDELRHRSAGYFTRVNSCLTEVDQILATNTDLDFLVPKANENTV